MKIDDDDIRHENIHSNGGCSGCGVGGLEWVSEEKRRNYYTKTCQTGYLEVLTDLRLQAAWEFI